MLTGKSKGQPWWGEGQFRLRAAHRSNIPQRAVCPWVKTYRTHITMNLDPILNYTTNKHTVFSPVHGDRKNKTKQGFGIYSIFDCFYIYTLQTK